MELIGKHFSSPGAQLLYSLVRLLSNFLYLEMDTNLIGRGFPFPGAQLLNSKYNYSLPLNI